MPDNDKLEKHLPLLSAVLGGLVFLIIFGPRILNPTFIGWTMEGDAAQHFLGWHFFRSESWTFPPGLIQGYQYPQGTSLVYTDSIPLLALPLKLAATLLPPVFQYHGLWLFSVYLLQGYFAALLLRKITKKPLLILLGIGFFLLWPVMVQRARLHESLAAHWIVLAALFLYFQPFSRRANIKWLLLLSIATLVHFYLLAMALVIWLAFLFRPFLGRLNKSGRFEANVAENHSTWQALALSILKFLAITAVTITLLMWLAGYFIFNVRYSDSGGFGNFSMNLVSPFNPSLIQGDTAEVTFLNSLPLSTSGQLFEGYNYLGFGALILIAAAALIYLIKRKTLIIHQRHLPLLLAAVCLTVLSLSSTLTLADRVLFDVDLPFFLEKGVGLVRSSGRMFWPVGYILVLAALAVVIRSNSTKAAVTIVALCLGLQIVDLAPWYLNVALGDKVWETPLKSAEWTDIMETADQIVFLPPNEFDADIIPFAFLAASHSATINVGVTARTDSQARADYAANLMQEFEAGLLAPRTLYVLRNDDYLDTPIIDSSYRRTMLDGYQIIIPAP